MDYWENVTERNINSILFYVGRRRKWAELAKRDLRSGRNSRIVRCTWMVVLFRSRNLRRESFNTHSIKISWKIFCSNITYRRSGNVRVWTEHTFHRFKLMSQKWEQNKRDPARRILSHSLAQTNERGGRIFVNVELWTRAYFQRSITFAVDSRWAHLVVIKSMPMADDTSMRIPRNKNTFVRYWCNIRSDSPRLCWTGDLLIASYRHSKF